MSRILPENEIIRPLALSPKDGQFQRLKEELDRAIFDQFGPRLPPRFDPYRAMRATWIGVDLADAERDDYIPSR